MRLYADSLGFDLSYQNFSEELAELPGKYRPPNGELLLAYNDCGSAVGCVGLRPLSADICEMKRLYVSPEGRGLGLGRELTQSIIQVAKSRRYREIRLDTFPSMEVAIEIYKKEGFVQIPPYIETGMEGNVFMAKNLQDTFDL